MRNQKYLALFAICACFLAFMVIGLGAFTRLIDAGLGCPDWPGCYGRLIAPINHELQSQLSAQFPTSTFDIYKAWAEMVHRYFAGTLGIFILAIVVLCFSKNLRTKNNIMLGSCLILLLVYQILLGQWTVTFKLMPIVVTQHLLGGFLLLTLLWSVYLNNRLVNTASNDFPKAISWSALIGLIILFVQIMLGAWTSTNYASLSCPDFPFCVNRQPFLSMDFKNAFNVVTPIGVNYEGGVLSQTARQTIQMMHRLVALLFVTYFVFFTAFFMQKIKHDKSVVKLIFFIWGLLFMQVCIGIVNIIYKLPLVTAVSHNIVAVTLLLSMVTLVYKLFSKKVRS